MIDASAKKFRTILTKYSGKHFISNHLLSLSVGLLCLLSVTASGRQFFLGYRYEQILLKQLATKSFQLANLKQEIENNIRAEEQQRNKEEQGILMTKNYFESMPLVLSTADGKGRLVGFSRLLENGGQAQYSFQIKHQDEDVNVSGTISNRNNRLEYSDDYNTPYQIRTTGEITHSKNLTRLHLVYVVTSVNSTELRVGDTFTASFVLPSQAQES